MITGNRKLPLEGIAIGDGWTDPINQLSHNADFCFAVGITDEKEAAVIRAYEENGINKINSVDYLAARDAFDGVCNSAVASSFGINLYNYREYGAYDNSNIDAYLNRPETKDLLHVPRSVHYKDCNNDVYEALGHDFMKSVAGYLPTVLKHIRVLLYNGQDDFIVNSPSAENWIAKLKWSGQQEYLVANKTNWHFGGEVAGSVRSYDNLTQLVINKAGHMVPYDVPGPALHMLTTWIEKLDWS
jgi:vitellogenic carboxypeptidase-like protein